MKTLRALGILLATVLCPSHAAVPTSRAPLPEALSEADFARVTAAVDRGLAFLATQQSADGSYAAAHHGIGQPAITALAAMAFLSRGHQPGPGPYGAALDRAIDFTLACQQPSGLFSLRETHGHLASDPRAVHLAPLAGTYCHAIALLLLGEVYGAASGERSRRIPLAIENGLRFTRELWSTPKQPSDQGGWRYLHSPAQGRDSDLSVTGWHVVSLRSVKNAGFEVPRSAMEQTTAYVLRCYSPATRGFLYQVDKVTPEPQIAMTGSGVLCLALAGQHAHPHVHSGIATIAAHHFGERRTPRAQYEPWFYYTCYYAAQAAAQVGGEAWVTIYRKITGTLLPMQAGDGSWPPTGRDASFGPAYSTAMALLSLTPQLQLLPIYQH